MMGHQGADTGVKCRRVHPHVIDIHHVAPMGKVHVMLGVAKRSYMQQITPE
jgi:hypothetical protein